MLYAYNTNTQTVATGESISYARAGIQTGTSAALLGTSVAINRPGYYEVFAALDGATADAAGNVSFQLQLNGVSISGAEATGYSASAANIVNLGVSTIIRIDAPACRCDTSGNALSLLNTGVGATITNASISVTKVC